MTDKQMEKLTSGRQYRAMQMRAADGTGEDESYIVEGYASTFNQPYTLFDFGDIRVDEVVDKRAFDNCDMSDVIFQYDHIGRVYARNKNGTLTVEPDENGLKIRADLGGTEEGRKLYEEIKGGYTDKMSFGFLVPDGGDEKSETEENGKTIITRTITAISKLYDVSAVSVPANDFTSISSRDAAAGVAEAVRAERLAADALKNKKRMMILKIRLELEK